MEGSEGRTGRRSLRACGLLLVAGLVVLVACRSQAPAGGPTPGEEASPVATFTRAAAEEASPAPTFTHAPAEASTGGSEEPAAPTETVSGSTTVSGSATVSGSTSVSGDTSLRQGPGRLQVAKVGGMLGLGLVAGLLLVPKPGWLRALRRRR